MDVFPEIQTPVFHCLLDNSTFTFDWHIKFNVAPKEFKTSVYLI